ncbi:MAG: hypothetical protein AUJ54_07700 [Ignavibacteria bacterium CG1_02_37_35]|nr:MAG: hypothetical protein AUJ54_07700 [Ignavibacteria bacterium CG1_02_37_35]
MAGYMLVEQRSFAVPQTPNRGVQPNKRKIGIADFLRELEQEEFPFDENSSLMVTGIEEYLLASRPDMEVTAREIRMKLQKAAGFFNDRLCRNVQIVFRQPLKRGEHLIVDHVTQSIPIYLIFNTPIQTDIGGQTVFISQFNLSGS